MLPKAKDFHNNYKKNENEKTQVETLQSTKSKNCYVIIKTRKHKIKPFVWHFNMKAQIHVLTIMKNKTFVNMSSTPV